MSLIRVSHLTFCYDGSYDPIFNDASFLIDTDWKLGFTGRNGRGKTTFLKLLMGEYPYRGEIAASTPFDYFPFDIPDESVTPLALAESMSEDGAVWRFCRECSLLGVTDDALGRPFSTLSQGERTKCLLAALFSRDHHYLLLDEPTNHLDMEARALVSRYLNAKRGFLLVSHDRAFLDGCVDHILSINRANIEVQKGNYSSWEENKRRQDAYELAENEKLKREIGELKASARQARDFADKAERSKLGKGSDGEKMNGKRAYIGEKSRRMQRRRMNLETRMNDRVEEKEGLLKNIERADELVLRPLAHPSGRAAAIDRATVRYGEKTVLDDVSLTIENGERVAIAGRNGCGKSTLLRLLTGDIAPGGGSVRLSSGLVISYVPQTAKLSGSLRDDLAARGIDETLCKTILRKLDFSREQFEKDMASFSAGQMKKVLIARSLCERAHLYIWDEPLNYIDVLSRVQIESLIARFSPTMVFVEHDRAFIDHMATRIVRLS